MRYGLGFILTVNASNFRQGFRRAGQEVSRFEGRASAAFRRLEQRQTRLAQSTTKFVAALSGVYIGVAAFEALTKEAVQFDFEVRALAAVTKTTATQMSRLVKEVYSLGRGFKEFTVTEVARASRQLAQAGYDMGQDGKGLTVLRSSLDAVVASLGSLNPDQAVQLGITLDKAFGTGTRGIASLFDTVGEAINMFPMQMDQVRIALGYSTASAQMYNQSLESTILTLGTLIPILGTASKAGVAQRNALAGLSKPATAKFLQKHGIAMRDSAGQMRDAMEIMLDIDEALDESRRKDRLNRTGNTEMLLHKMFGIRGKAMFTAIQRLPQTVADMPGMSGVIRPGLSSARDAYHAMRMQLRGGSGGALERLAQQMGQSSVLIDQRFKASISNLQKAVGEGLLPIVDNVKEAFTALFDSIRQGGSMFSLMVAALQPISDALTVVVPLVAAGAAIFAGRIGAGLIGTAFTRGTAGAAGVPLAHFQTSRMNMAASGGLGGYLGMGAAQFLGMGTYRRGVLDTAGNMTAMPSRTATGHFTFGDPTRAGFGRLAGAFLAGAGNIISAIMIFQAVLVGVQASIKATLDKMYRQEFERIEREKQARKKQQQLPEQTIPFVMRAMGFGKPLDDKDYTDMMQSGVITSYAEFMKAFGMGKTKGRPVEAFEAMVDKYTRIESKRFSSKEERDKFRDDMEAVKARMRAEFLRANPTDATAKKFQKSYTDRVLDPFRNALLPVRIQDYQSQAKRLGVPTARGLYDLSAGRSTTGRGARGSGMDLLTNDAQEYVERLNLLTKMIRLRAAGKSVGDLSSLGMGYNQGIMKNANIYGSAGGTYSPMKDIGDRIALTKMFSGLGTEEEVESFLERLTTASGSPWFSRFQGDVMGALIPDDDADIDEIRETFLPRARRVERLMKEFALADTKPEFRGLFRDREYMQARAEGGEALMNFIKTNTLNVRITNAKEVASPQVNNPNGDGQ